jgi:hypothetical protein
LADVRRSTVYLTVERLRPVRPEPERPFAHLASPQPHLETDLDSPASDVKVLA